MSSCISFLSAAADDTVDTIVEYNKDCDDDDIHDDDDDDDDIVDDDNDDD